MTAKRSLSPIVEKQARSLCVSPFIDRLTGDVKSPKFLFANCVNYLVTEVIVIMCWSANEDLQDYTYVVEG